MFRKHELKLGHLICLSKRPGACDPPNKTSIFTGQVYKASNYSVYFRHFSYCRPRLNFNDITSLNRSKPKISSLENANILLKILKRKANNYTLYFPSNILYFLFLNHWMLVSRTLQVIMVTTCNFARATQNFFQSPKIPLVLGIHCITLASIPTSKLFSTRKTSC